MYNKFVNFMSPFIEQKETSDYWYDVAVDSAQEILEQFSEMDWEKLVVDLEKQPIEFKRKLVYCFENTDNKNELTVLLLLINTDDEELFDMCIDTLRSFDVKKIREIILLNPTIISRVKERIKSAGIATKGILQNFLDNLNK